MKNEHLADQMSKGTMYRMTAHAKSKDMGGDPFQNATMDLKRAMKTWKAGTACSPRFVDAPAPLPWINYVLTEAANLVHTHSQLTVEDDSTHSYLKKDPYMHKHFVMTKQETTSA